MKTEIKQIIIFSILFITIIIAAIIGQRKYINENVITKIDTIYINVPDSSLVAVNDSLCIVNDSLYNAMDSIINLNMKFEEELTIALFKLDRIKQYNKIAGNRNNIKYLRGWINRTLNE